MAVTAHPALYDKLGLQYEEAFGHDQGLIDFVQRALTMLPEKASVLDIGCGTGKPTCDLVLKSGRTVYGIDYSPVMVDLCRSRVPEGTYEKVDVLDFQPERRFDAAFAVFSLLNLTHEQMEIVMAKVHDEWLAPDGLLLVGTMTPEHFFENTNSNDTGARFVESMFMGTLTRILLYTEQGWKKLLEGAGFKVENSNSHNFQPAAEAGSEMEPHYYIAARRV
ncbi:MAG: hypothetical protein MMC23_006355 [Stictis urceolatum]|nr:hypothetical protein [Stictis urceolata]